MRLWVQGLGFQNLAQGSPQLKRGSSVGLGFRVE